MRTATRPQYHRLQRILEMIREGTRAGSLPNCRHFTRELEISRRTLMRDLDFLRDDHHAPIAYHGNWYLRALNTAAGRTETFALSRCRSLAGTGQHFPRPAAFDAKAFFKDAFGISQADQPWNVRLLFAREGRHLHPRTNVAPQPADAPAPGRHPGTRPPNLQPQRTHTLDSLLDAPCQGPRPASTPRPRARTNSAGIGSLPMTPLPVKGSRNSEYIHTFIDDLCVCLLSL